MLLELRLNEPVTLFTKRGDSVLYYDITAREQGLEMSEEYKTATECRLANELAQTKLLLESLKTQNEIVCKLLEEVQNKWFESREQLEQERAKNEVQPRLEHTLGTIKINIAHSFEELEVLKEKCKGGGII